MEQVTIHKPGDKIYIQHEEEGIGPVVEIWTVDREGKLTQDRPKTRVRFV